MTAVQSIRPIHRPEPMTRHATVATAFYPPLKSQQLGCYRPIPWINLRGIWLQELGFYVGQRYAIEATHQQLIVSIGG